ncbi:MAG: UDP-3-O-(3-hydroxymyristoyl)glucosamine N-acyltransferase [Alphaproteobacteria bacterium]|jgi:UDP-3-O-[3-hydroxymyristoyl] glucosamine N-acyltransferase|nr:UDP-3-O-(3-hydroxymyristoyl)glucosamine N-acyltransferase [Alphaproteobacteria bacterium]
MSKYFKAVRSFSVKEIAELVGGNVIGNAELIINSASSLEKATLNDISFFNKADYLEEFSNTKAGACFIVEKYIDKAPQGLTLIVVSDPYLAFATTSMQLYPLQQFSEYRGNITDIHESAKIGKNCHIDNFVSIGKNVVIGDNVYIGANTVIYDDVAIGSNGYIYANVSIKCASIGDNFIIHDGVRIGQDGFGFAPNKAGHIKIPQVGGVIIGNNVEIGANTCVDRGALNDTIVGEGTKIDNMVQIAHNVVVGKHCFLASGVGIAGSTIVEDYVSMGGGAGVAPHIRIGLGAQIAPMSGVSHDVEKGATLIGVPAINFTSFWRLQALFKRMLQK